jgi:hypothetical protein
VSYDYDPLLAVGVRLGTPNGREFFDRHMALLTEAFGGELVRDIEDVAKRNDLGAAERVCDRLCPGTTFEVSETEHSIAVAYRRGADRGVQTVDSDPFFSLNKAVALATASIKLNAELRAAADQPLVRMAA